MKTETDPKELLPFEEYVKGRNRTMFPPNDKHPDGYLGVMIYKWDYEALTRPPAAHPTICKVCGKETTLPYHTCDKSEQPKVEGQERFCKHGKLTSLFCLDCEMDNPHPSPAIDEVAGCRHQFHRDLDKVSFRMVERDTCSICGYKKPFDPTEIFNELIAIASVVETDISVFETVKKQEVCSHQRLVRLRSAIEAAFKAVESTTALRDKTNEACKRLAQHLGTLCEICGLFKLPLSTNGKQLVEFLTQVKDELAKVKGELERARRLLNPIKDCPQCKGTGFTTDSEEGGITVICDCWSVCSKKLLAENEKLREDKKRLDWLDNCHIEVSHFPNEGNKSEFDGLLYSPAMSSCSGVRDALDAAIASQAKTNKQEKK